MRRAPDQVPLPVVPRDPRGRRRRRELDLKQLREEQHAHERLITPTARRPAREHADRGWGREPWPARAGGLACRVARGEWAAWLFDDEVVRARERRELGEVDVGEVAQLPGDDTLLCGVHLLDRHFLASEGVERLERVGRTCVRSVRERADFAHDENRVFLWKQLDGLDDLRLEGIVSLYPDSENYKDCTRSATAGCSIHVKVAAEPPSKRLNIMSLSPRTSARYAPSCISASTSEVSGRLEDNEKRPTNGRVSAFATDLNFLELVGYEMEASASRVCRGRCTTTHWYLNNTSGMSYSVLYWDTSGRCP